MTHQPLLPKITAFILRPGLERPQILAFQHPSAGLQLPASTVDPGETPEAAALHEMHEGKRVNCLVMVVEKANR